MEFVASTVISRVHNRGVSICRAVRKSQFEGNNQKKREVSSTAIAVAKKYAQSNFSGAGWDHFYAPASQKSLGRDKPSWAKTFEDRGCDKNILRSESDPRWVYCGADDRRARVPEFS